MVQKFSKSGAIKFGLEVAKRNVKFFALILIFIYGTNLCLDKIANFIEEKNFLASLPFSIASGILSAIFSLGLIKISLNFLDGQKPKFSEIFSQYQLFFRYLFTSILYSLIVILGVVIPVILSIIFSLFFKKNFFPVLYDLIIYIGLAFSIVLGILAGVRFGFFVYFLVDKKSKIIESLKKSWQITRGNTINLTLFYILLVLLNIFGALALIIGLFWTLPATMVAEAFVYRKLLSFFET